MFFPRKIFNK